MEIDEILKLYARSKGVKALGRVLSEPNERQIVTCGLVGSAGALAFASLSVSCPQALQYPYLFVLDDAEEAGYFYHDLVQMLGDSNVLYFPSSFRRAVKYGQRDAANEVLRTEVLSRLSTKTLPLFVVSYPDALAELVVSHETLSEQTLELHKGEMVDIVFVEQTLLSYGFHRVDYVYEPGQFAVRGSILDVFSFSGENPFRVDFFGDEVDSIRSFQVQDQLSLESFQKIAIVPELSGAQNGAGESLLTFLPKDTMLVMKDLTYLCEVVEHIYDEGFISQALIEEKAVGVEEETTELRKDQLLISGETFSRQILDFRRVTMLPATAEPQGKRTTIIRFNLTQQPILHKNFDLVNESFSRYLNAGYALYILADSLKQTERLQSIFEDQDTGITFHPVHKTLHQGFADNDMKVCFFTDHQIFDRFHKYNLKSDRARSGKVALTLKELQQFEIGDYVVHIDHGVGRFGGLVRIPKGDQIVEQIKIIYQDNAAVFVSIHALHKVSKYKGREGEPPRVNKLGGGAWEKLKERTKTKIKDIARDLIKLYSRRRQEKGFAFSPDCFMQHELEASFLYEDTPDQLKATQDVKADMEKARPMDRLVCGDVGFGKTEVAIRAAFKACCDGKQVAVMVPTTVLAYQHFRTFSERLKDLPVRVDYLSRARSAKQTKDILAALARGEVNIIVGTHKLIGKTVQFRDLGLLIIDEEQKFGVSVKEKLRQMKTNVDTLTLTATPIPRTLQFSLMGARDLSVIQTPPPNRYPIQTELHTFNSDIIAQAVNFEMSRNGQVFIINNRISGLHELKTLLEKYVPDARVAVGHGQMSPEALEQIMLDFANYDYDVLISTTIIESGLDIPNANTIIICGAQNFGLSDLHQMRGRVGRSNRKAFCYLLAPPLSGLNPEARRRLQAIENFSDLGSGIHIAMQDLDIRGAGNLLGAEQSGFIADLGYETYQKVLNEAVNELRNDEFQEMYQEEIKQGNQLSGNDFVDDCQLESDLPMYFHDSYVPGSSERMLLYRELDGLHNEGEIEAFRQRMKDRFGPIPPEGEELIRVVTLRRLGRFFGAELITLKVGKMRMYFVQNQQSAFYQSQAFGQIIAFASTNIHRCKLEKVNGRNAVTIQDVPSVQEAVALLQQIKEITSQ